MLKNYLVKHPNRINNFFWILLIGLFFLSLIYGFVLAYKRYVNFEHGKFDLGNMSQIVWNTSRGNFMEITDQFGTNMPRWGMSHFDPILVIFAPIYWFWDHPMILVFAQHVFILSALIPLYLLAVKFTNSRIVGLVVGLTYVLYPAIGFTLVWTGFHGISFVAPLFIWLVWFLEKYEYFSDEAPKLWQKITYWILIVLMLMGKEEIGAILAIYSFFLYFKNKKLAIITFIVSIFWFITAFFVIIPSGEHYRTESVHSFLDKMQIDEVDGEQVAGENFFLYRYSKLGTSYGEMIVTLITRPVYVFTEIITPEKIQAINNLIGPLGYIVILSPIWIVSAPDIGIVLLSDDAIFDISNHRIAFIISALFLSYLFLLKFIYSRISKKSYSDFLIIGISVLVLISTVYFSNKTHNPMYVSGASLIHNKIIAKVFADQTENNFSAGIVGTVSDFDLPRNNKECLNIVANLINENNPEIYTGPDYLGAHAANRRVNALFPSRYWDADLVVADIFDAKALGPFGDKGWTFNKKALRGLMTLGRSHAFSCGQMSTFKAGESTDNISLLESYDESKMYELSFKEINMLMYPENIPSEISVKNETEHIEIVMKKKNGDFHDNAGFWFLENVENNDTSFGFIDYMLTADPNSIENAIDNSLVHVKYTLMLAPYNVPFGKYKIYYGVGDLIEGKKMYLGDVNIVE